MGVGVPCPLLGVCAFFWGGSPLFGPYFPRVGAKDPVASPLTREILAPEWPHLTSCCVQSSGCGFQNLLHSHTQDHLEHRALTRVQCSVSLPPATPLTWHLLGLIHTNPTQYSMPRPPLAVPLLPGDLRAWV